MNNGPAFHFFTQRSTTMILERLFFMYIDEIPTFRQLKTYELVLLADQAKTKSKVLLGT